MLHSPRSHRLLCLLILCCLTAWEAWAQADQMFVAVREKSWVNADTPYIIAAENSVQDSNMRGLYALTTTRVTAKGNMLGLRCGNAGDEELTSGLQSKMLWRIEQIDNNHVRLRSFVKGNYLCAPTSTTLALNADADVAMAWEWLWESDGSLRLCGTAGRQLGFSHLAETDSGYYKQMKPSSTSACRLRLFCPKNAQGGSAIGEATMQTDGTLLALRQGNSLIAPTTDGGVATYPAADYLNRQETVALSLIHI